jgi:hypothetical protein
MTLDLKAGTRLRSAVCTTEVVVVRAPAAPVDLRCGGQPLLLASEDGRSGEPEPGFDEGTLLGKRYTDAEQSLEILCTKAGAGSLSIGDSVLQRSGAKPLPASD